MLHVLRGALPVENIPTCFRGRIVEFGFEMLHSPVTDGVDGFGAAKFFKVVTSGFDWIEDAIQITGVEELLEPSL